MRPRPVSARLPLLWALVAACAGAPAAPTAAPAPPPSDAQAYYPLEPGWRWAYDVVRGELPILATYVVAERAPGVAVVQAGQERLVYAISKEGIARREGSVVGDFLLKTPIVAGAEWAVADGKARVTAVGKSVTVPAGTFENCAVVEEARSGPDRIVRTTYAAGVGPVAIEVQQPDPRGGAGTGFVVTTKATLRGVTRPGEAL